MVTVAAFLISGFLPVVAVAVVLGGLRLWRLLAALAGACASVFGVLLLIVVLPVFQREPTPGNTEPPFPLAVQLLYAAVVAVILCDVLALVGVPILFLAGRRLFGPSSADGPSQDEDSASRAEPRSANKGDP